MSNSVRWKHFLYQVFLWLNFIISLQVLCCFVQPTLIKHLLGSVPFPRCISLILQNAGLLMLPAKYEDVTFLYWSILCDDFGLTGHSQPGHIHTLQYLLKLHPRPELPGDHLCPSPHHQPAVANSELLHLSCGLKLVRSHLCSHTLGAWACTVRSWDGPGDMRGGGIHYLGCKTLYSIFTFNIRTMTLNVQVQSCGYHQLHNLVYENCNEK